MSKKIILIAILGLQILMLLQLRKSSWLTVPPEVDVPLGGDWNLFASMGLPIQILQHLPYLQQIDKDLKPFANGITQGMIRNAYELGCSVRLQYINKTLYSYPILKYDRAPYGKSMCHGRGSQFAQLVQRTVKRFPLIPEFELVINALDNCRVCDVDSNTLAYDYYGDSALSWPPVWADNNIAIFSFQKLEKCRDILIPACIAGLGGETLDDELDRLSNIAAQSPWSNKKDKIIWRGSGTGGLWNNTNLDTKARYRVFLECDRMELRHVCDVGLSRLIQTLPGITINSPRIIYQNSIPMEMWMRYKYQLVLDGNGSPAGRIDRQLIHNSLLLMQETEAQQMYTKFLRPYVHYVPLKRNLSDLVDAYHWASHNEVQVSNIIRAANKFAKFLKEEPIVAYTAALLIKYSNHLNFQPQLESGHTIFQSYLEP